MGTTTISIITGLISTGLAGSFILKNKRAAEPAHPRAVALFLFLGFLPVLAGSVYAAGPGTGAANFLKIPVGARETSLGGAFTAVADNANAVYYNPAGLSLLQNPEISFTQNKYVEGISQQWLAAAYPYRSGAFGLGFNYLSVPAFDAYDGADNRTGAVAASDMALYLSWGGRLPLNYKFLRSVSYGASVKYIAQELDTEKGTGYGLDLGLLATTPVENLRFGLEAENAVSSKIKFIEDGAAPSLRFKAGAMYEVSSSVSQVAGRYSLDYVVQDGGAGYIAVGVEQCFYDAYTARLGYSAFGDITSGLSFGLGYDLFRHTGRSVSVDYAYGGTYAFGDIHKLGVTYKFGRTAPRPAHKAPAVRPVLAAAEEIKKAPAADQPVIQAKKMPLSYYLDTLKIGSSSRRRAAVAELGARGGEDSLDLLLTLLKDEDPVIATAAIAAAAGLNDPRVIEPLIALLEAKNVDVRLEAVTELRRYKDPRVVKALKARLGDPSAEVRSRAASVLGGMENVR
ncbi:MAG TPA: hypothetical protein DCS63_01235 [Elusimicrobia bacterium]|nr:hypothetical protein [Elusimicrobiota bacterium]